MYTLIEVLHCDVAAHWTSSFRFLLADKSVCNDNTASEVYNKIPQIDPCLQSRERTNSSLQNEIQTQVAI